MKRTFRSNRSKLCVATAATAAAFTLIPAAWVHADAPLFDNFSSYYYDSPPQGPNYSTHYFAPDLSGVYRAPDSMIAGTSKGDAYVLPAGTTSLTGIDTTVVNETQAAYFNGSNATGTVYPQSNGGTGTLYDAIKITVSIWGQVNNPGTAQNYNVTLASAAADPTSNIGGSYVGSLNSSNQAFSDLLATETYFFNLSGNGLGGLPPGYIEYFTGDVNGLGGISPDLPFGVFNKTTGTVVGYNNANGITTGPVNVAGLSSVGFSYDFQGSTDGGLTYQHVAGLVPLVAVDAPSYVGGTVTTGTYTNFSGESNGNYAEGPYYYTYNDSTGTKQTIPNEGVLGRVFGIAPGTVYNWGNASAVDADFSDSSQWNPNGVPGGNDTAVFNLGSTAGYSVQISDFETAYNLNVLNDNVAFDLNAEGSELYVQNVMTVGVGTSTSTHISSTLTLENSGNYNNGFLRPNSLTIGGNGSTGIVVVTAGAYLGVDNNISINAGSKLIVQKYAGVDADTLIIGGTTNAWTGQLDIGYDSTQLFDGDLATVTNQLKQGFNGGHWNGNGIISAAAASDTTHLTAVGAVSNNVNGNPLYSNASSGGLGIFDGDNPPLNAVLLRYTYYGDANLDGTVDGSDYSLIDNGFLNHLTGWYNGDFNYDGVVNGSDYTLIDNAYDQQYGPVFEDTFDTNGADISRLGGSRGGGADNSLLHSSGESYSEFEANPSVNPSVSITAEIAPPAATSAVPEPASIGVLAMAAVSVLSRRSRRSAR